MARAATTSDAFNAVAEPRRREILTFLALRERPVGDIVATLGLEQPSVSKHLRVLRNVGLVHVRRNGRQKLYRTNARGDQAFARVEQDVRALLATSVETAIKGTCRGEGKQTLADFNSRRKHEPDDTDH